MGKPDTFEVDGLTVTIIDHSGDGGGVSLRHARKHVGRSLTEASPTQEDGSWASDLPKATWRPDVRTLPLNPSIVPEGKYDGEPRAAIPPEREPESAKPEPFSVPVYGLRLGRPKPQGVSFEQGMKNIADGCLLPIAYFVGVPTLLTALLFEAVKLKRDHELAVQASTPIAEVSKKEEKPSTSPTKKASKPSKKSSTASSCTSYPEHKIVTLPQLESKGCTATETNQETARMSRNLFQFWDVSCPNGVNLSIRKNGLDGPKEILSCSQSTHKR